MTSFSIANVFLVLQGHIRVHYVVFAEKFRNRGVTGRLAHRTLLSV